MKSHTVGLDWVQPAGKWTLTPGVRYYTQSAAHFYLDPKFNAQGGYDMTATILSAIAAPGDKSFDQRLAAFGAATLSMKVAYAFTADTSADIKVETYRQTSGMRLGGDGSPGLDPFRARFMQVGLTHRF